VLYLREEDRSWQRSKGRRAQTCRNLIRKTRRLPLPHFHVRELKTVHRCNTRPACSKLSSKSLNRHAAAALVRFSSARFGWVAHLWRASRTPCILQFMPAELRQPHVPLSRGAAPCRSTAFSTSTSPRPWRRKLRLGPRKQPESLRVSPPNFFNICRPDCTGWHIETLDLSLHSHLDRSILSGRPENGQG